MRNLEKYLDTYGSVTFKDKPICEIDLVMLSQIIMIEMTGVADEEITLEASARKFQGLYPKKDDYLGAILSSYIMPMFRKMATLERYKNIILKNYAHIYDEEQNVDTSAITYVIDENKILVAFSGTSDSIISWKEDFVLLYSAEIGAQRESAKYINNLILHDDDVLTLLGHSKGGNLAMYAGAHCNEQIKERIQAVYSFDGPGFREVDSEQFASIKDRIVEVVPEKSLIGRLFEHIGQLKVLKSDRDGFFQHDVFTWMIEDDSYIWLEKLADDALHVHEDFSKVLLKFPPKKREEFVNAIFKLMIMTGAKNLTELEQRKSQFLIGFFKLDLKSQTIINKVLFTMFTKKNMGKMLSKSIFSKLREIQISKKSRRKVNEVKKLKEKNQDNEEKEAK